MFGSSRGLFQYKRGTVRAVATCLTWLKSNRKRKQNRKQQEKWWLIPPRESSSLSHPLWADSNEGPSRADGHLLHRRTKRKKENVRTNMKKLVTIIIMDNLLNLPWKPTKNKECFGLPPMIPMQHSNIKSFCLKENKKEWLGFHCKMYFCLVFLNRSLLKSNYFSWTLTNSLWNIYS